MGHRDGDVRSPIRSMEAVFRGHVPVVDGFFGVLAIRVAKTQDLPSAGLWRHLNGMSRTRQSWRAAFINYPKHIDRPAPKAFLAKRSSGGDFTPGNGRRQCVAIAKRTGERCRCTAIGGVTRCRAHRGLIAAVKKLKRLYGDKVRRTTPLRTARRALFQAGLESPKGFKSNAQGVERGRQIEAFKNRNSRMLIC